MIPHEAVPLHPWGLPSCGALRAGKVGPLPGSWSPWRWVASEAVSQSGSLGACSRATGLKWGLGGVIESGWKDILRDFQAALPSPPQPPPLYSHLRIPEAGSCQVASVVSDSVRPHGLQPTRLLCPWDSPGKNTGVGGHFLLQCI